MFQAVRQWWGDGRGKVTARLFLFEFVVVVVGVLVAQGLTNRMQERGALAKMERARTSELRQIQGLSMLVSGWRRAAVCLDQRMTDIMVLAGSGKPIPPTLLRRPNLYNPTITPMSEDDLLLLAERHGVAEFKALMRIIKQVDRISTRIISIGNLWSGLSQVDPANGPVGDLDRAEARKSAAAIKLLLKGITFSGGSLVEDSHLLGLRASMSDPEIRLIRSCDDLWQSNETHPNRKRFP